MKESDYKRIIAAVRDLPDQACNDLAGDADLRSAPEKLQSVLIKHLGKSHASFMNLMEVMRDVSTPTDPKFVAFLTAIRYRSTDGSPTVMPVCTLSHDVLPGIARTKEETLKLLSGAQKSIYLMGYWLTQHVDYVIKALEAATSRGVKIVILADSEKMFADPFLSAWDKKLKSPSIYVFKASKLRTETGDGIKMHAKTIIVDDERMMVTSANLTHYALNENIEVGVLVSGRASVSAVSKMVNSLIHNADLFERVGS